jgi:hypothetical protein
VFDNWEEEIQSVCPAGLGIYFQTFPSWQNGKMAKYGKMQWKVNLVGEVYK